MNAKTYVKPFTTIVTLNVHGDVLENNPVIVASNGTVKSFGENEKPITDESETTKDDPWAGTGF